MAELYRYSQISPEARPASTPHAAQKKTELLTETEQIDRVSDPDRDLLEQTVGLLASGRLTSAAFVARPLTHANMFVAKEWWHCLVVEESLAHHVRGIAGLASPETFDPLGLLIYRVRRRSEFPDVGGMRAVATQADVKSDLARYYGRLAEPEVGGAHALFAAGQEAARELELGDDLLVVGGPEAFGFRVNDAEDSTSTLRQRQIIAVEAFGFSLPQIEEASDWLRQRLPDSNGYRVDSDVPGWIDDGLKFGVAIVLKGLDDPPVVIPTGAVYQHPQVGLHVQNLAVARPASVMVAAGATVPLILPAYCLNPTFSPPSGPMVPTPLVLGSAQGSQDDVWRSIRQQYRERQ